MNHNNQNKKLFQEKFQDFEPELDRDIWAGIEKGIKKRKVPFFSDYRRMVMVAAALVLIFFVIGIMLERSAITEVKKTDNFAKIEKNQKTENQVVTPKAEAKKEEVKVVETFVQPKAQQLIAKPYDKKERNGLETSSSLTQTSNESTQNVDKQQVVVSQEKNKEEQIQTPVEIEKVIPKPKIPDMKRIEAVAATKNTPANDWQTVYLPAKTKPTFEKQPQVVASEAVAQKQENLNTLDLANFSLNNVLVFASHKMDKLANKPLNVYHSEDNKHSNWTYIFKLKGIQIVRKVHKSVKKTN